MGTKASKAEKLKPVKLGCQFDTYMAPSYNQAREGKLQSARS